MNRYLENQRGFTLIEMLIVIMIISVLLMIAIPNMTKNNEIVTAKGCDATINLLQSQVHAYEIETGSPPDDIQALAGYADTLVCPNNTELTINDLGKVVRAETNVEDGTVTQ